MSELINKTNNTKGLRWQLLATTSAMILCTAFGAAHADDGDRPTVWVELGGQLSHLDDSQEVFAPHFPNSPSRPSMFSPSQGYEGPPPNSFDESGKISFEPQGTDWVFSAALRYGRSNAHRNVHQQTYPGKFVTHFPTYYGATYQSSFAPKASKFADTSVLASESHTVLDFQAGKDVGLGMFGHRDGSSVFSVGIRFAQFSSKTNVSLKSDPDWHFGYTSFLGFKRAILNPHHTNQADLQASRSFHGVGPSLAWNGSAPILGTGNGTELSFDWGVNAALLFGRQKAKVHHQTTGRYLAPVKYGAGHENLPPITYGPAIHDHARSRSVIVPNIGAVVGATYRIENFKLSAGYRADFFFGAMDDGIDTRKTQMIGFYGPFATVSVGLGG